jgi:MFS family permease
MPFTHRFALGVRNYLQQIRKFNRNVRLLLLASMLSYLATGIFSVDFNLYILSLGIKPDQLGRILTAAPLAHMIAAIPIGFFAERLGFRKAFLVIYSVTGLALLFQVASSNVYLITGAAFVGGLAISGDFVVRLPFLSANVQDTERTHVFSMDAFLSGITFAVGALLAGFLPNLFRSLSLDLTTSYRTTLYFSGILMALAVIPVLMIKDHSHLEKRKISLSPYLWGMDRFTIKAATIEFFIGLTFGMIVPFMNIIFLYHLNTSREFYSTVEAFAFIPVILATLIGPILVARFGNVRAITLGRSLVPVFLIILAFTIQPLLGSASYWSYKALFSMSQSLWFAFAMATASKKSKAALSSWLEITFQIGMVVAAPTTGFLLSKSNYSLPFYVAAGAAVATAVLTWVFMIPHDTKIVEAKPVEEIAVS